MTEYTFKGLICLVVSILLLVFIAPLGNHLIHVNQNILTYWGNVGTMGGIVLGLIGLLGGIMGIIFSFRYIVRQEDIEYWD